MPASLESLHANDLDQLTHLPKLPTETLKQLCISKTFSISQLPSSLPSLIKLDCSFTGVEQLPALPSCQELHWNGVELQQLPEPLPAGLRVLSCCGSSTLLQLPAQLPPNLESLSVSNSTAIKQLPELPHSLQQLKCEDCESLRQLPDLSKCQVQDVYLEGCFALEEVCVGGAVVQLESMWGPDDNEICVDGCTLRMASYWDRVDQEICSVGGCIVHLG